MSSRIKVFLLLAFVVCMSTAQLNENRQQCLCQRTRDGFTGKAIDIQIYPKTIFCGKVEIVVTTNNGIRYCLNPSQSLIKILCKIMNKKQNTTTVSPEDFTSNRGSTIKARI